MVTINEADVIRIIRDNPRLVFDAMREDPKLLKEVRQAILTDEILDLPRKFAEMSDTLQTLVEVVSGTNARVEGVETRVEGLETRVERVETKVEGVDARVERVEVRVERVETRVERVETTVDGGDARVERVETKVDRLESLVGYLVGSELERKMGTVVPNRLEAVYQLDDIHILVYQDRHPAVDRDFLQTIDRARGNAVIDDVQHRRLRSADMIVRASHRGNAMFFTVEASSTVAEDDIDRAIQSALALEKVVEAEVIPVVIGYAIPNDVREYNAGEKSGRARIFEMRRRNR